MPVQAPKNLQITQGSSKVSGALNLAGQKHLDLLLFLGLLRCVAHVMPAIHGFLQVGYLIQRSFCIHVTCIFTNVLEEHRTSVLGSCSHIQGNSRQLQH